MYVDSHHYMSYLIYRMAGLGSPQAALASYANQQVDDNCVQLSLPLAAGLMGGSSAAYVTRTSLTNTNSLIADLDNLSHEVVWNTWFMYHFIAPGVVPPGCPNPSDPIYRCVTTPVRDAAGNVTNPTADALMQWVCRQNDPYLLGIAGHMMLDTYSHQQWVGINHDYNYPTVDTAGLNTPIYHCEEGTPPLAGGDLNDSKKANLVEGGIGHTLSIDLPDRPTAAFNWTQGRGGYSATIRRDGDYDNTVNWVNACNALYGYARQFLTGSYEPMSANQLAQIRAVLTACKATFQLPGSDLANLGKRAGVWTSILTSGSYTGDDGSSREAAFEDYTHGQPVKYAEDPALVAYVGMKWWADCINQASTTKAPVTAPDKGYYLDVYSQIDIGGLTFDPVKLAGTDFFKFQQGIKKVYDWMSEYYLGIGITCPG